VLNEMSHQSKLQWLHFGQMTNLEKILKQKIQQNINTTKKNRELWIKIFLKNQLNYELAKQEQTQLWKQWQKKIKIRQQKKI